MSLFRNILWLNLLSIPAVAQQLTYTVTTPDPASHLVHVELQVDGSTNAAPVFKMPVWTPGYYQLMNYAGNVSGFTATDAQGKTLTWSKPTPSSWKIDAGKNTSLRIRYDVLATRSFVAASYLNHDRAYLSPAGVFLHLKDRITLPVTVTLKPLPDWSPRIATGLEPVAGQSYTFAAPDFDVLYDSPILMGKLEELPAFSVKGIPHYFVGYQLGQFDKPGFMADLSKIVTVASELIGDIPYKHYTFIAIGPGGGGIEHLNSTSVAFDGNQLNTRGGRLKLYNFLAHEYFHHYNVKRIRPVELGPFNYDAENKTRMLWVSEGFTVYYEYLVVRRAGLMSDEELFSSFEKNLRNYENKPGRLYQSATQASYETWSDGPFGRTGDEVNKTISYYDKGPVLGLLLDFRIRYVTGNKKSLDDVMRALYQTYYKEKKRGFTEDEFRKTCESIAGKQLNEVFDYASTTRPVDYPKYFAYAGLNIDTTQHVVPGGWTGLTATARNDSLTIRNVEYESPAWQAGLRSGMIVLSKNGAAPRVLMPVEASLQPGADVILSIADKNGPRTVRFPAGQKREKPFTISRMPQPDTLQKAILESWLH
ncbi:MAG: M61 family metallopeptidase [Siphonobacter aquaeclarae]|nr:M61 family metallopeptidase [Siphonobacter aquaeclarae]